MSQPPVLVFGDDGSPWADVAWLWVCGHPWTGWRAEVITAVTPPIGPPPGSAAAVPHPWEPPEPRPCFDETAFVEVAHLRAEADPRALLGGRTDADLLVVGARGEGLLKELHLGSTAEYLLHHPPAPLLVVTRATPTTVVVVAADGSPHARAAVDALRAMPWLDTVSRIEVVTVGDDHEDWEAPDVHAVLDEAASVLAGAGPEIATRQLQADGSVASTLLEYSRHVDADLLALGTRGLGAVRRLLMGSTATAVTARAECPVLLARAGA